MTKRISRNEDEDQEDLVGGDRISIGNITGSKGIAVGRGAQATVTERLGGEEIAKLFATIYQEIEDRPEDPDVDKEELAGTVRKIQQEAAKGKEANPNKLERWLKNLAGMAPDIFQVAAATLSNPAAGVAAVIRNVIKKAQEEAGKP